MENVRRVFYKGKPYEYKVLMSSDGERRFSIYENGVLAHFLSEAELDRKVTVAMRMDNFFSNLKVALLA